jgi:hypothetical protein
MSRITTWTEDTKQDFLRWLGSGSDADVCFGDFPLVNIRVKGEASNKPTTYIVEFTGLGFTLRDKKDETPRQSRTEAEELPQQQPTAPESDCYGEAFAVTPVRHFEEMAADFLEEFVPAPDHEAAKVELESIFNAMDSARARALLDELLSDRNPTLCAWAMACAWNLPQTGGRTQTQIAARCGVTKAALSKRVRQLIAQFGCVSRVGLSRAASAAYSNERKRQ